MVVACVGAKTVAIVPDCVARAAWTMHKMSNLIDANGEGRTASLPERKRSVRLPATVHRLSAAASFTVRWSATQTGNFTIARYGIEEVAIRTSHVSQFLAILT